MKTVRLTVRTMSVPENESSEAKGERKENDLEKEKETEKKERRRIRRGGESDWMPTCLRRRQWCRA